MFGILLWLLLGALLGNVMSILVIAVLGQEVGAEYIELIVYPIMFIPAMIACRNISNRNMLFETGYKIDSNNFAPVGGGNLALLCILGTIALGWCLEPINYALPEMPEWLEETMTSMTQGVLWVDFICVSIMAPIFEEWLCRGMVLRGLLNYERVDKEGNKVRGLKPWLAIVVSAAFFAVIHMNPWQAIPAFALGCLFGYVYYRTGSLKLTMLMHFTNNTLALILSNIDSTKDADSLFEVIPMGAYVLGFVVFAALIWLLIDRLRKVELVRVQGNSDEIPVMEDQNPV